MRPYVKGEDLTKVSVSETDNPVEDMGMIARNPADHKDQWYVARKYFEDNLELGLPIVGTEQVKAAKADKNNIMLSFKGKEPFFKRDGSVLDKSGLILLRLKTGFILPGYAYKHVGDFDNGRERAKKGDIWYTDIEGTRILNVESVSVIPSK